MSELCPLCLVSKYTPPCHSLPSVCSLRSGLSPVYVTPGVCTPWCVMPEMSPSQCVILEVSKPESVSNQQCPQPRLYDQECSNPHVRDPRSVHFPVYVNHECPNAHLCDPKANHTTVSDLSSVHSQVDREECPPTALWTTGMSYLDSDPRGANSSFA